MVPQVKKTLVKYNRQLNISKIDRFLVSIFSIQYGIHQHLTKLSKLLAKMQTHKVKPKTILSDSIYFIDL